MEDASYFLALECPHCRSVDIRHSQLYAKRLLILGCVHIRRNCSELFSNIRLRRP